MKPRAELEQGLPILRWAALTWVPEACGLETPDNNKTSAKVILEWRVLVNYPVVSNFKGSLKRKMEAGGSELGRLNNRKQSQRHNWQLLQWAGGERPEKLGTPAACDVYSPVSTRASAQGHVFWPFGLQKCKKIFCVTLSCQTSGRYIFDVYIYTLL